MPGARLPMVLVRQGEPLVLVGSIKPFNRGPGWLKAFKARTEELRGILDLQFEHVLPVHGAAVIGGATEKVPTGLRSNVTWLGRGSGRPPPPEYDGRYRRR